MQGQGSNAPTAPVLAPVPNAPIAGIPAGTTAAQMYEALRAQRRELTRQLETLESTRQQVTSGLQDQTISAADRSGLQQRMTAIDKQIASLDEEIAAANAQVAKAAAIPGAIIEEPPPPNNGPPEEAYALFGIFIVVVLFPLSFAFARRIWRRSAKVVTTFPKELADRLSRLEQTVESSAVEIERIGEGQRFLTRLFTEGPGARAVGAAAQQQLPVGSAGDSGKRLP